MCTHGTAQTDTVTRHLLPEVGISTSRAPSVLRSTAPSQVVDLERMEQTGAVVLSDAVRRMAGVVLKDYGGVGGIKTVSARGLGSQFTSLMLDGVAVNDCQNGQVDLGRYLLGNSAYVNFANAQEERPLQTARAYAAGNVLNMETARPAFYGKERAHVRAGLEGGSFGLWSPSLGWDQKLGRTLSASVWGNFQHCDGDYPFTLYYDPSHTGRSSRERRTHSQSRQGTADANLFFHPSSRESLHIKGHYVQAFHALPGPVTYYTQKASEHSEEMLAFAQAKYNRQVSQALQLQVVGKVQTSTDTYEDTASLTTVGGRLRNHYAQQEVYTSVALSWTRAAWALSWAGDGAYNAMQSNMATNNRVRRGTAQSVAALRYDRPLLHLDAHLLATAARETATTAEDDAYEPLHNRYRQLSPYVGLSVRPFGHSHHRASQNLRLRYFFKETYRVPNFNEMYYYSITRRLEPEKAVQHNLGLTVSWSGDEHHGWLPPQSFLSATADVYYNRVRNKIVAVPMYNMFLWSMMNIGKVDIVGVDATAEVSLPFATTLLNVALNYTYQHAVDHSTSSEPNYGHQIPYTPRHSGNLTVTLTTRWCDVGYVATGVGKRYCLGQNAPEYRVDGYVDQGLTLSRRFTMGKCSLLVRAQVQNLFDVQYEVVRSYPMMGRHFRLGAFFSL